MPKKLSLGIWLTIILSNIKKEYFSSLDKGVLMAQILEKEGLQFFKLFSLEPRKRRIICRGIFGKNNISNINLTRVIILGFRESNKK